MHTNVPSSEKCKCLCWKLQYKNEFKKEIELVVYNKRYNKSRYTSKYERVMSDVTRSSEYESVERSV